MKKLLIYVLIVALVGCVFSIAKQDAKTHGLNSSVTSVIGTIGAGVACADTLDGPHPPLPPSPIPK